MGRCSSDDLKLHLKLGRTSSKHANLAMDDSGAKRNRKMSKILMMAFANTVEISKTMENLEDEKCARTNQSVHLFCLQDIAQVR